MATFIYPNRGRSFVRSTVLLLAVAATSYVAGALSHNPTSSRDVSATFSTPARAAELSFPDPLSALGSVAPAIGDALGWSDGERIPQPRECDLAKAISTECLFMD